MRHPPTLVMSVVKTVKDRQGRKALLDALNQEPRRRSAWWEHKERVLQEWLLQSATDLGTDVRTPYVLPAKVR